MSKPKSQSESIHYESYVEAKKYLANTKNRYGRYEKDQYARARRRQAKEEISEQADEAVTELLKNIPPEEAWLYENKEALESVKRGLEDSSTRRLSGLEEFPV